MALARISPPVQRSKARVEIGTSRKSCRTSSKSNICRMLSSRSACILHLPALLSTPNVFLSIQRLCSRCHCDFALPYEASQSWGREYASRRASSLAIESRRIIANGEAIMAEEEGFQSTRHQTSGYSPRRMTSVPRSHRVWLAEIALAVHIATPGVKPQSHHQFDALNESLTYSEYRCLGSCTPLYLPDSTSSHIALSHVGGKDAFILPSLLHPRPPRQNTEHH